VGFGLFLPVVVYVFHGRLAAWQLDGKEGSLWEIVLKAVAGYIAVIGAVITAFKYIDEKTRQREQDSKRSSDKGSRTVEMTRKPSLRSVRVCTSDSERHLQ
jgi:hypothetical protein